MRAAHDRTGIAAADYSRIRNAELDRFTADRLMSIINRLGSRVEVKVRVRRVGPLTQEARAKKAVPVMSARFSVARRTLGVEPR